MTQHLLAATAVVAIAAATAAAAGESPYTGPGSNSAALNAQHACEPQVNEAERILIYLPPGDPRGPAIVQALQLARAAMRDGQAAQCLQYVQRAREIEGHPAADPRATAHTP